MNSPHILATPPKIYPIDTVELPEVYTYHADQAIPVYEIRKPGCDVILAEAVFYAGRPQEVRQLAATCLAGVLREGAGEYDAESISELVDFYGATLSISASMDLITVRIVCLKKYLPMMTELMTTVIADPHIKAEELSLFVQKRVESLHVELAKNDVISYRELTAAIYGADHPYGYNSSVAGYQEITTAEVREHYDRTLRARNCNIFISGDVDDRDRLLINSLCRSLPSGGHLLTDINAPVLTSHPKRTIQSASPMQTSIKIGRRIFNRRHADYDKINYVSTLLGGYFGSRLVSRIREDLGLTYGIYATVDVQLFDGSLMIATEVANDSVEQCIDEIYKEIDELKNERVDTEELQLVNNYLMGHYLNLFDGPFNSMKAIKSIVLSGIPLSSLNSIINSSVTIDADQVMETAHQYFNRNDFWEVIVGSPKMTV